MARDNYSYQRYQKELAKKKKKEEKMLRKLANKKTQTEEGAVQPSDTGVPQTPDGSQAVQE